MISIVKCSVLRTFQPLSLLPLRGFTKLKKAIIKSVVRRPLNLSEFFFLIFEMFIKRKKG